MYDAESTVFEFRLTVQELEDMTTYGGTEADRRIFTPDQINELKESLDNAVKEALEDFLNFN